MEIFESEKGSKFGNFRTNLVLKCNLLVGTVSQLIRLQLIIKVVRGPATILLFYNYITTGLIDNLTRSDLSQNSIVMLRIRIYQNYQSVVGVVCGQDYDCLEYILVFLVHR